MKKIILLFSIVFSFSIGYAQRILTPIDEGSKVHFVIRNFGIRTGGDFNGLKGKINFDPKNLLVWTFNVSVDASTIDTDNSSRDGHLKKSDYFDVSKYPTINIVSTKVEATETPGIYLLSANLTIKDVTLPVKFNFKVNKKDDGYLFIGDFDINRRDYNVGGSSISLSDSLNISLSVFAK